MPRAAPERTCVVCRRTSRKRELVRIVRTGDDRVEIDQTGKRSGRGAYLCHDPACWRTAVKGNRLESALKTKVHAEQRAALAAYAEVLARDAGTAASGGKE
jgi:predicted RNA-binding protein YlxR (DUF448 family)